MKSTLMFSVGALVVVAAVMTTNTAHGRGAADSPPGALVTTENLGRLAAGAAFDLQNREMSDKRGGVFTAETRSYYATLSVDLLHWLTVSAGGGQSEVKPAKSSGYGDGEGMWTAGVEANIWEHEVKLPTFMAHILRVQGAYRHFDHEADLGGETLAWTEDTTSLTLNFEFFTHPAIDSSPALPYSAVFSAGPASSIVDGDAGPGNDFEQNDEFGMVFGLDLKLAPNVSLGWQGRAFSGDLSHTATAVFHF
jgi:hypothetical protein